MNWNSIDRLLFKVPKPLLRVLCALLIWIGFTFTLVSITSVVIIGFRWMNHLPSFATLHQSPGSVMLQNFGMLVGGLVSLILADRVAKMTGFAGIGAIVAPGAVKDEWGDGWRAFFRPGPNDRLNDWVIHFEYSPDELKRRFALEQKFPRAPAILALFLVDGTKPVVQVNGQKVCLATGVSEFINSPWRGHISTDELGNAILQGKLGGITQGWYATAQQVMWKLVLTAFGLGIIAISLSNGLIGLPDLLFLLVLLSMWYFNEAMHRSFRRSSRRHERQIESFFKGRLEAQAIYLTPRIEIFSKDWFKNFRKNR